MKAYVALLLLTISFPSLLAQNASSAFVCDTPREFYARADFDGDGKADLVVVDKETGKYRLGYQQSSGVLMWVDCRPSGMKGLTGFSVGKVLPEIPVALAFTSPDANQITLVGATSPTAPSRPVNVPFSAALGPSTIVALGIGGEGKGKVDDFYVASIYNSPDPNLATLLRNDGADYAKISESALPGPAVRGNRLAFKPGQEEFLCVLVTGEKSDSLRVDSLSTGKLVEAASVAGLPSGSEYTLGTFRGAGRELLLYKPGQNALAVRPVDLADGKLKVGEGVSFDLGSPVRRVIALDQGAGQKLMVIFGEGQTAGIFNFDGVKAPALLQTISATNDLFTFAAGMSDGFIALMQSATGKFATRYQIYKTAGATWTPGPFGSLPTLADNDNITIPDIHARILANLTVTNEAGMKPFTNQIPGTRVTYVMVPIPGGEFLMGSPDNEPDRKPDEGPQHKVKVSPFWMGRCEVTWNEYELFMYPDEERRMRATVPTDAGGDKLADAVTHPSKPYVEMSFGMGKDGFPAIAMTQHAANKYCQWLSAKTGQFYRLPTEAEWEYACRAGTTTAHFFPDSEKLSDYAWYEQNSDFKYQKVGKKKPNPW